jgi:hypothetical protein
VIQNLFGRIPLERNSDQYGFMSVLAKLSPERLGEMLGSPVDERDAIV